MNKLTRINAILSALFLLSSISNGVQADEACGDGGGGSKDIASLTAEFDEGSEDITVEMTLCAAPDNHTKYRVRFDHTAPFAPDADRNGDTFINADDFCVTTSDDGMMHRHKKDTGPGEIMVDGEKITFTVNMAELNPDLTIGDTILLWADTQHKGIHDRAPDTDSGDGCDKPEQEGEFIELQLANGMTYEIGDTGPAGGIVFYVTDGGLHGLEAAPVDQIGEWGCMGTTTGATETVVNTGDNNTSKILAACPTAGIAARIADNYSLNSYDDWFLPSIDELELMYTNLYLNGWGGFCSCFYWSSSEYNSNNARQMSFFNGVKYYDDKNLTEVVRVVRIF